MKRLLKYVFLLVLIGGVSGYFIYQKNLSPCKKPLEYSIGRFDAQFGISREEFKTYITESEKIWENELGKDIFIYDSTADFKINLIYDERQLTTVQKQKTEFGLSAVEETFKKLDAKFYIFKNEYDQRVFLYEQTLASYESRKSAYEKEVVFWNKKGGAPKDKYDSLNEEKSTLDTEAISLNSEALAINNMTKQLNVLLEERNIKADEYNKIAENYNKKYNGGLEFNQAEYIKADGEAGKINVYQFSNKKDLILALTHEFGHALGMDHVENPKSIMYYITDANTETSPTPSTEDLAELKKVCEL
jgi:hypothetical protein